MIGAGTILTRIAQDLIFKANKMHLSNVQGATMKEVAHSIVDVLQQAIDEDDKGKTGD